jgi:hypothetical protein
LSTELGKVLDFRKAVSVNNTIDFEQYNPTLAIPDGVAMIWHVINDFEFRFKKKLNAENFCKIKEKSILISHYAICGFSNFGSIAIQMATLSSLAPNKSKLFAKIALKSMIAGNIGNK